MDRRDFISLTARPRRGMTLIYVLIIWTVLCGFVSLGVDFGRVQLAKTQLERAAFAAARAGAAGLSDGTASSKAIAFAAANNVDGTPLVLTNADVVTGTWTSGGGFSAGGASQNAVRINAYRTNARGTAIPLLFAQLFGKTSCDIKCIGVVATSSSTMPLGFTGLNSFAAGKTIFAGSYNSGVTTNPSHATHNNNGLMQTNGTLANGANTNSHLYGNAKVGPAGSVAGGLAVSGTSTVLGSAITSAAVTMQVVSNPGGIGTTYSVPNGTVYTAPGGTYYLTSISMGNNCSLTFSGPAVIYMDGNFSMTDNNTFAAYNSIPANLVIYQSAGHTFTLHDSNLLIAVYNGPSSDVTLHNSNEVDGAIMAKTITVTDNDDLFYDEALAVGSGNIGMGH